MVVVIFWGELPVEIESTLSHQQAKMCLVGWTERLNRDLGQVLWQGPGEERQALGSASLMGTEAGA